MKFEIGPERPENWQASWPGKYDRFSHFEFAAGIPQVICAVSTRKPDGQPNLCLHAWNTFQGDGGKFLCLLCGLSGEGHTVANLRREGDFCVNFLSREHMDGLRATIAHNGEDEDEFAAGGFHAEASTTVTAPRVAESFLVLECLLVSLTQLPGQKTWTAVGEIVHAAAREGYMNGVDRRYGPDGFIYNIHSPQDASSGVEALCGVATLKIEETY